MYWIFRFIFPIFAVALAITAALVSIYPFGESTVSKPVTLLKPFTETTTWVSTYPKEETSTVTYYTTFHRTEINVLTDTFTTIKAGKPLTIHHNLPKLEVGDNIIIEAGSQVKVWIEDSSGETLAEAESGDLSYVIETAGKYSILFEAQGLKESREIFIGVSRPESISTETREYYTTYRWTTTITEEYAKTQTLASTLYSQKTVVESTPLTQRILVTAILMAIAASLGIASILLWKMKPSEEASQYRYDQQPQEIWREENET